MIDRQAASGLLMDQISAIVELVQDDRNCGVSIGAAIVYALTWNH
jgi:hypothetical protein